MQRNATTLEQLEGISHGFFTRQGGKSGGVYHALNCGYGSGDDVATVAKNRAEVTQALGAAAKDFCTAYQIHSADAVTLTSAWEWDKAPQADALVTNTPGLPIGVLTADCAPVLLADPVARVVGAAHAGWKGAFSGIIPSTIAAMERLGARRERIQAAVGPCIAQASYEVGADFQQRFLEKSPEYGLFFVPSPRKERHFQFDLSGFVKQTLGKAGVTPVEIMACDTYALEPEFFSYRRATLRSEPVYGRQVSAIMLTD